MREIGHIMDCFRRVVNMCDDDVVMGQSSLAACMKAKSSMRAKVRTRSCQSQLKRSSPQLNPQPTRRNRALVNAIQLRVDSHRLSATRRTIRLDR